jgi:hypothetical protein
MSRLDNPMTFDPTNDPRPNVRDQFRVGRRNPSKTWLVKEAPGWKARIERLSKSSGTASMPSADWAGT